jgi:hypothetical protein
MVGHICVSAIRLAWLDRRALEYCGAVDHVDWMFGQDHGDECRDYHGEWECGGYDSIWVAGGCCGGDDGDREWWDWGSGERSSSDGCCCCWGCHWGCWGIVKELTRQRGDIAV